MPKQVMVSKRAPLRWLFIIRLAFDLNQTLKHQHNIRLITVHHDEIIKPRS